MRRVINKLFMTVKITLGVRRAASEGNVADLCRFVLSGLWAYQFNCDNQVVGDKITFGISSNHAFAVMSNSLQMISCNNYYSAGRRRSLLKSLSLAASKQEKSGRNNVYYSGQAENLHV